MKFIIVIPSRIGSTRLPEKPLKKIGGISMINHVCKQAQATKLPVYIATDSEKITKEVQSVGIKAIITKEHPSGSDRVHEALEHIEEDYDYVINLQGDLPFFKVEYLNNLVEHIKKHPEFDIATLGCKIETEEEKNCADIVKIAYEPFEDNGLEGKAIYFSRYPVPYNASKHLHHIGVYAWKKESLDKFVKAKISNTESSEKLEQLRALNLGMKISYIEVEEAPISIDTKKDLEEARKYYKNNIK